MTRRRKRLLFFLLALSILPYSFTFVLACAPLLPPAVVGPAWGLAYEHLSLAPRSNEPYGVYANKGFGLDDEIAVAFYDGHENHVFIFHPGGDDHRHAAMMKDYHLRVSAPDDREASRMLREYLTKVDFKGSIRLAVTFAHGAPARPLLGRSRLSPAFFDLLSEYRPRAGFTDVAFVSCDVAQGDAGKSYIQRLADEYSIRVSASDKSVEWYFASKWLKGDEGKRNFEFEPYDWWTAVPRGGAPRKYLEVFNEKKSAP